ncbi:hypothetical protein B0J11DRAFT_425634 [Dendryphion nanum]|uniref:RBR-type E3 ubiquitin transferase n=1 Tax=Dendryphion nanum TaxID=256645 RepID=A0A9P9EEH6_9PLEO|nr:hypothetical protein B0J11DRAFT_425634 [Dendryphion nanum]
MDTDPYPGNLVNSWDSPPPPPQLLPEFLAIPPPPPPLPLMETMAAPPPPPPPPHAPYLDTMPFPPPVQTEIICIICCDKFPLSQKHIDVIFPCKPCGAAYCVTCVKGMFITATEDVTRMPPRCCVQIQLHHARPHLTEAEAAAFRTKYEEWNTPHPFYCPVPACSTFIPLRLLKLSGASEKGKTRVDSVVGTPTSPVIACPKCSTDACTNCRELAHTGPCKNLDFGLDEETTALLKSWGYKRCPKCGQGIRRMYGCNHLECICGAHFCWVCLRSRDDCDGGACYEDEDEDYSSEEEQDTNESESSDEHPLEVIDTSITNPAPEGSSGVDAISAETSESSSTANAVVTSVTIEQPTTPLPVPRRRNLDAGSHGYWENQGLDFGEEPTDDIEDRAWSCYHNFSTVKLNLEEALRETSRASLMECTRCWKPVHPEVELPEGISQQGNRTTPATSRRIQNRSRSRGRGRIERVRFQALRDQAWRTSTLGTEFFSTSAPAHDPMEDVVYSNNGNRVVDTYGNVITSTDFVIQPPRRLSFDFTAAPFLDLSQADQLHFHGGKAKSSSENDSKTASFSFAYGCLSCGTMVCDVCKEELLVE